MAAHGGGVDWATAVKPILSANYGNLSKADVLNIIKAILKSENDFFDHDAAYGQFYMAFSCLAADTISGQCNLVCQTQIPQMLEASSILIRYILGRLGSATVSEIKWLLPPMKALCEGKQQTQGFDHVVLASVVKSSKFPEHSKGNVSGSDKDSPKSEMKRSRSDLSTVILQQLNTPLSSTNISNTWAPLSEELTDCTQLFATTNISVLKAHNAGDILLNLCTNLPVLSRYRLKYEECALQGKPLYLPLNATDATQIKNCLPQMSTDISIFAQALSLPILEPLTPTKITQLSQCAMSSLYCAVLASISGSVLSMVSSSSQKFQQVTGSSTQITKDTEEDDHARVVVDKALEIYTAIGDILKNSTRGHIYQNHLCFGAWLLIAGIQGAMGASGGSSSKQQTLEDGGKGKSPSRSGEQQAPTARVNLFKVQQGFGVLNAAIARHSLLLLTELIDDLKIESRSNDEQGPLGLSLPDSAGFDILEQYSSLQRVVRVLSSATLQQLLTFLATVSYRKACMMKRASAKERNDGDPISYSDSTTYFNDTISTCSEDSETEEEDSESYLGLWFKETLSPEAHDEQTDNIPQEKNEDAQKPNMVPAKDEPHEYIELSAQIFAFLDQSLGTNHKYLNKYVKSGLSEQQMILLANILKDLDRDAARGEPENSSCAQWQGSMIKFSGALGKYLHNLISASLLNETLQSSLLLHLGVSPWTQDNVWPLQVYSRTLSVLVQILLLKPTQEKEAACLSVWHRLVNTLVEGVCSSNHVSATDSDYEDLNVEHAQLLLFLFHSLNLMQKKSILLLTAGGVIRCAEVCRNLTTEKPLRDHQLMLLSRLLLFLEYLMKHLYNAPTMLLEQVRWNLFSVITLDAGQKIADYLNNKTKLVSFCRKDIEDKHKKLTPEYLSGVKPKFYSLTVIDTKVQQEFKLDGLAWNFILCTPDKLKYPLLVDALIDILSVTDICANSIPYHTLCSVHYCFSLCWKLLLGLPPSTPHVEALMHDKVPNLHSLVWSIRCRHPAGTSHYLIVNSLIKQGMYTQYAETLWNRVTEHVSDIRYSLKQTLSGLELFVKTFHIHNPRLSKVLLLDALIAHMHAMFWAEREGFKPPKPTSTNTSGTNVTQAVSSSPPQAANSSTDQTAAVASRSGSPPATGSQQSQEVNRDDLVKDVAVKLFEVIEIVRLCMHRSMEKSLSGTIPISLLDSLIAISSSKSAYCTDISTQFLNLMSGTDKDVITSDWNKSFNITGEDSFSTSTFPVDIHTLTVIEAHLGEVSKHSNFSILLSLKHCLKSAFTLLSHLLPSCKQDAIVIQEMKSVIVPMLFDIRTEYLHEVGFKNVELVLCAGAGLDAFQFLVHKVILDNSYRVLIEYAELSRQGADVNLDEVMLYTILKQWEQMLEKSTGLSALQDFFYASKNGSLVDVLISFTNTQMSQMYATKVLQFFEKLFQTVEKNNYQFTMEQLASCISELGHVDNVKLKAWLSHILLGPGNNNQAQISSVTSSNAQTPTNMATVSAIPSISDQIMQSSEIGLDPDAMEIDEECSGAAAIAEIARNAGEQGTNAWQGNSCFTNRSVTPPNDEYMEKNGRLLQNITKYFVSESKISPSVPTVLFRSLIQLGQNLMIPAQDALDLTDLLQVMITLADASKGKGHSLLFAAAVDWLEVSKSHVLDKQIVSKSQQLTFTKSSVALQNVTSLLRYMNDLLQGMGYRGSKNLTPPWEEDLQPDFEDIMDEIDDDDSAIEDSDEDSLGNKLCTFSQTQKEFMNQHWYHCHTCNMVDTVGVCSVCARVCHKNHDVTYAKYGNFFCDCGAKEDGSCQALRRRISNTSHNESPNSSGGSGNANTSEPDQAGASSSAPLKRFAHNTAQSCNQQTHKSESGGEKLGHLAKVIEASKDQLNNQEQWKAVVRCLLEFFELLMPSIRENCALFSTVGCHARAKSALERLHQSDKNFYMNDQILVATLGSQEGAFENVRMSYSGEQGQTIKQLLSSGLVRRVALCCLSSPHGKRQHLAVSHEKGKVTILQLSALLKQADAAKRKLTLTQLASAPIPCTILSLTANPANEDCLAVCGLKECHILMFSSTGAATEHIVLTPQLETGNFIKRAIWLPGSQTKLALVTADFVKIYELAEDTYSPQYYFLVAVGKIRDCTFVYKNGTYHMLLIASSGYIYTQPLDEESLAKHGDFYVTNTLELNHPQDISGQIGGGGVSIYYSHTMQILFFSYSLGKSFMAPLTDVNEGVKCIIQLQVGASNSKVPSKGPMQPLCQWTEIPGHPGLICAMMHTSNNPVIFMLKPDTVDVQEIKAQNSKSKIMDMVAIRHTVSGVEKTTLILLCEDGSLRIYTAHLESTNYWLSPEVQPIGNQMYTASTFVKPSRKNRKSSGKSAHQKLSNAGSAPSFPIDFFEHSTMMPDVEFGGNDLLQIYNTHKLKSRLFSTGMFVASSKPNGFTLEINNPDPNMVITGIRVLIGSQDPMRAPQSVTLYGRTVPTVVKRSRWFDIPLTREESLQSDKKLSVLFGRSQDPESFTMLDGIKVYGKTKDAFGWPEEQEETALNNTTTGAGAPGSQPGVNGTTGGISSNEVNIQTVTLLDKMVTSMLEVVDSGLSLLGGVNVEQNIKQKSIAVAKDLLLLPTPNPVQLQTKCVLATLHGNRSAYHSYKDKEILSYVNSELRKMEKINDVRDIDPEGFYRLILLSRSIAVARPQTLTRICVENEFNILPLLLTLAKKLHDVTPTVDQPTSIVRCGLSHTEAIVHCLIEIIYAFALSDQSQVDTMTKYLVDLLLDTSKPISHSAKEAMILLMSPRLKRRKVTIDSPPVCSTPTPLSAAGTSAGTSTSAGHSSSAIATSSASLQSNENYPGAEAEALEPMVLEAAGGNPQPLASLEAFLGIGSFPQLLDLQQDADDEAIMDIAIALSLQEHDGDIQSFQQGLANLQGIRGRALQSLQALGAAGSVGGDTSASAGGSDDEGSTAATDGSTLRTSPAEHAGSGGSESGGSGVESIGGASGRSSTYGDQPNPSPPRGETTVHPAVQEAKVVEEEDEAVENENQVKLHSLRCAILNKMVDNFGALDSCSGHQAIPLMQVILTLTTDLDGNLDSDQQTLNQLLNALSDRLQITPASQASEMTTRKSKTEVQLAILYLISVLMGKTKSSKTAGTTSPPQQFKDNASFVAGTTANVLMRSGALPYCLVILESFLPYWKTNSNNDEVTSTPNSGSFPIITSAGGPPANNLLKPLSFGTKPDISSLFPQNYVKNFNDIFEAYSALLTEIAVRLPYQILKLSSGHPSSWDWYHKFCETITFTLCEYMMLTLSPVLRRQVRKLLMYICGNKEKFRLFRDGHSLTVHMSAIKASCDLNSSKQLGITNQPILSYDALVEFTEHLRACHEIATVRTGNWQKFCSGHEDVIPALIQICCYQLDDGVSPMILQLLQAALCNTNGARQSDTKSSSVKSRQDRDKSEESEYATDSKFDPTHCGTFVNQIFQLVPDQLFQKFVNLFLLETNITLIRGQMHGLLYAIYENSNDKQKERLIAHLWDMWPQLPAYGRRTAQFVDILGYLTLSTKSISDKLSEYTEKAVGILRQQNELLSRHPNAPIYTALGQVLDLDGFYLESEPCLVCNNPDVAMSNIKLATIKSDSKFTTTTTIVKLVQSHTISKIILRIADLKRTKMVRTINIYYNNRTVQAVVELKNRPSMWHKARKVTLQSGQTEVKIDFPLPITACNLMIEYADFYETVAGSSENLQCPRCSAAVPAYPGVCGNCGENVFQCHKCRAINYDEKDPFLCHACGFCKYAKFDYTIYGRACCAVDPIESAEDRSKTVQTIHLLLEKADRIYRQLQTNKQILELFIQRVAENKLERVGIDEPVGTVVSSSQVNKVIQILAQKYSIESKTSFEELSKVVQKVKACRRELLAYDRSQMDLSSSPIDRANSEPLAVNHCYGCALAATEQCLTILRAMASNISCRTGLYSQGLVEELAQNNLRRGTNQIQDEVRQLLCLLTRDLPDACKSLCALIHNRVKIALNGVVPLANLDTAIRHEMALLEALVAQDDSCWELKLKVVFELFLMACKDSRGPAISVIQRCLRIIQSLICPLLPTSKSNKEMTTQELTTLQNMDGITVDYRKWLANDERHTYAAWKARMPPISSPETSGAKVKKAEEKPQQSAPTAPQQQQASNGHKVQRMFGAILEHKRAQFRNAYLCEKYGRRWRNLVLQKSVPCQPLQLTASWLQPVLFNTNSRFARQLACALITSLSRTHDRKREILNLLTDFLKYIGEAGEASAEFLILYRSLTDETPWRQYLALKGVITLIADLLTAEIEKIHRLEETTLSSDLAQGYALRQFVELMSMFLENATIRQAYKGKLLGPVLQGYLSLRKLVVQRTRLVDDAQEKLLEMLEEMTSGTEEETRAFMSILIDTVRKTPLNDIKTPVFIFERLYSIIHPEENDDGEFFLTLEKDPQQEDFLQGRMLGNPYPSTEAGLGPLMRDVKNKICTDCELIALLEDDNGMELLVNNKIISLDLPVKDVYKKIWLAEGGERDAMRVVYRMRGLLGDATEEFVETLNNKSQEEVDNEQLYRMANVLADCDGLKVMLDRISHLQNITRTRELVQVLLKLFLLSVKVRRCQQVLCQPELEAINTLLKVLQLCMQSENDAQQSSITEQLLEIMETILSKAASDTLDSFLQFSLTFGGPEYVTALISCTNCLNVRNSASVLRHLIRVLAALVYGNEVKMALLCEHFQRTLDFNKFDSDRTAEDEFKMELFCILTNQIEHNSIGGTLKDYIVGLGIVDHAIEYIIKYAPCVKPTLLRTDSDELKEFISRPSLKYILRFLTGLANKHEATQVAVSKDIIPIIHRLEQVSSDEHVGSLAENLLEALCTDETTAKRVQEVRDFTRAEKKRLAMATREKQLDALGMRTNEKGQVTAKGSILQKIEKLRDETGLTCFICREGYACQPSKVLGIYTFTKRTNVEEFELKTRKTLGYTTVTHFNVVHIDCHTSAIRLARGRDEWERASLQNANTRCNGLLPLWGPDVSETAFSTCMSRHNSYMQESTQRCDITVSSSIHDLKLLLVRFAWEKSFHEDAGGGGPQSNMHLVPYLLFYALYNLLSSRSFSREEKTISMFLSQDPSEKWLECAYEVEGPLYQLVLSLAIHTPDLWRKNKINHLKRTLAIAQARHISPNVLCKALLSSNDRQVKDYAVYKPYLMMWALIDLAYKYLFKTVVTPKEEDWPISLFDYIRRNDEAMLKSTDTILQTFTDEYLPCTSFAEFCDVAELLNDIENPDAFLTGILQTMPTTSTA